MGDGTQTRPGRQTDVDVIFPISSNFFLFFFISRYTIFITALTSETAGKIWEIFFSLIYFLCMFVADIEHSISKRLDCELYWAAEAALKK